MIFGTLIISYKAVIRTGLPTGVVLKLCSMLIVLTLTRPEGVDSPKPTLALDVLVGASPTGLNFSK